MGAMAKRVKNWFTEHRVATIVIPLLAILIPILFVIVWDNPGERVFLPNLLLDQAELDLAEGDFDQAIANAEQAIEIEPENPRIWLVLYAAHELNGDREEAMEALREGTRHVRRRETGGAEIRATLAAAEISPKEGLATVVESYQSFGLHPFARRLLQVLVRVFEGVERFAVMLEEEMGVESYTEAGFETEQEFWVQVYVHSLNDIFDRYGELYFALLSTEYHDIPILLFRNDSAEHHWYGITIYGSADGFSTSTVAGQSTNFYRRRKGTGIGIKNTRISTPGIGDRITYIELTETIDLETRIEWSFSYPFVVGGGSTIDQYKTVEEFNEYAAWFEQEFERLELIQYVPGMNIKDAWIR